MRLPYLRSAAPEVLATARAQRWDPAEVLRVLITEEIRGRDDATRRMRRKAAGLPAGKTFESWREADSSIPPGTQTGLATLEWVSRADNLSIAGPSGTGKTHFVEALAHKVIDDGMRVSWFTLESLTAAIGRATVDGSVAKTIARITARSSSSSMTSACSRLGRPPARRSTASSTPPTNGAASP